MLALLQKNFILKKRRPVVSIVEILYPVVLAVFLGIAYVAAPLPPPQSAAPFVPPRPVTKFSKLCDAPLPYRIQECAIGVVKGEFVSSITPLLERGMPVVEFNTTEELSRQLSFYSRNYSSRFLLGLFGGDNGDPVVAVGENSEDDSGDVHNALSSLMADVLIPYLGGPRVEAFGRLATSSGPSLRMMLSPYVLPGTFGLLFLFVIGSTLVSLGSEGGETGPRQMLFLAGVSGVQYVCSWAITTLVMQFLGILGAFGVFYGMGVLEGAANVTAMTFTVFILFLFAALAKGFFLHAILSDSTCRRFGVILALLYLLLSSGLGFLPIILSVPSGVVILLSIVFPIIGFQIALYTIGMARDFQTKLFWSDGEAMSVSVSCGMLVVSTVLYFGVSILLESPQVRVFLPNLLSCKRRKRSYQAESDEETHLLAEEAPFAREFKGLELDQVSKSFGGGCFGGREKKAVDNVSVRVRAGGITMLLGENGAGKSTIISMLIGSASLDEGSIFVHGVEMRFSTMSKIQNSLGVCLQKDLLWDRLTVQEHLELFLRLRNVALDSVESQIRSFDLVPDQIADTLSGGQKRKLCLAIALVGEPKLVILDEPSAGVSLNSQMEIWQILREFQLKSTDTTILMCSHDMDECEVLAKEIIVIRKGVLLAQGTIPELAKKFDCGYSVEVGLNEDVALAKQIISSHFPKVHFAENRHKRFILCKCGSDSTQVPKMCAALDKESIAYRLRVGSLKDIFLELIDA